MAIKKPAKKKVLKKAADSELNARELTITITGSEPAVRRAAESLRFAGEWNHAVTRHIARVLTFVTEASLDDPLGGQRLHMFSQDARDLYRQRCVEEEERDAGTYSLHRASDMRMHETAC